MTTRPPVMSNLACPPPRSIAGSRRSSSPRSRRESMRLRGVCPARRSWSIASGSRGRRSLAPARPPGSRAGRASRRFGQLRACPVPAEVHPPVRAPGAGAGDDGDLRGHLRGARRAGARPRLRGALGGRPATARRGTSASRTRRPVRAVHPQPGGGRLLRALRAHGPARGGQSRRWSRRCIGRAWPSCSSIATWGHSRRAASSTSSGWTTSPGAIDWPTTS